MDKKKLIPIAIADGQCLFADGLGVLFSKSPYFTVTNTSCTLDKLLINILENVPRVILLDANLPPKDGFIALKEIRKIITPSPKIIFLTGHINRKILSDTKLSGADGLLHKSIQFSDLCSIVQSVALEKTQFAKLNHDEGCYPYVYEKDVYKRKSSLTDKEISIANQLIKGHDYKEIGNNLNMAEATVATHKKKLFKKLNINKLAQLNEFIQQSGIAL